MSAGFPTELVKEFVVAAHFNLDKVKELLEQHPALLTVEYDWGDQGGLEDGLAAAAHMGNRAIAEFFLSEGVPPTICAAAMLGRVDAVRVFLDADPAQANARGAHGIPILFHAAMSGSTAVAELLRSRGCNEGFNSALHGAISYGHQPMVAWLLDNGASRLDVPDFEGKTPLQRAVESDHAGIADLLRQRGATA